jgi:hypothetical protein
MARPLEERRRVLTGGTRRQADFDADKEDLPFLFELVSDKLYSDPIAAVIREYSCNAWDAHVDHGCPDKPFRVELPSIFVPELVIRDYGPGLCADDVFGVYIKFAKSTKRESNNPIGQFGLGAKAAFAYSTSWTIVSYFQGLKSTYTAFVRENKERTAAEISIECKARYLIQWMGLDVETYAGAEGPDDYVNIEDVIWDDDISDDANVARVEEFTAWLAENLDEHAESGMEIRIPVQKNDIYTFQTKAERVLQLFTPLPEVEGAEITPLRLDKIVELSNGSAFLLQRMPPFGHNSSWAVIMGNVGYALPLGALQEELIKADPELHAFMSGTHGVVLAEIGDLEPNPNRESLAITKTSTRVLVKKLQEVHKAFLDDLTGTVGDENLSSWQKRKKLNLLYGAVGIPVPDKISGLRLQGTIHLLPKDEEPPATFTLRRIYQEQKYSESGRRKKPRWVLKSAGGLQLQHRHATNPDYEQLIIRDTDKPIARLCVMQGNYYSATGHNFLIVEPVAEDYSFDEKELEEFLKKRQIDGIPRKNLSDYPVPEKPPQDESGNLPPSQTPEKRRMYSSGVFEWTGEAVRVGAGRVVRGGKWGQKTKGKVRHSDNWKAAYLEDMPVGAVYVVIDQFVPYGYGESFEGAMRAHEIMLSTLFDFSDDMPTIYGLKKKAYKKAGAPEGAVQYDEWILEQVREGMKELRPFINHQLRAFMWTFALSEIGEHRLVDGDLPRVHQTRLDRLAQELGKNHPIVQLLRKTNSAWRTAGPKLRALTTMCEVMNEDRPFGRRLKKMNSRIIKQIREACAKYELLAMPGSGRFSMPFQLDVLETGNSREIDQLIYYIKLEDKKEATCREESPTS